LKITFKAILASYVAKSFKEQDKKPFVEIRSDVDSFAQPLVSLKLQ